VENSLEEWTNPPFSAVVRDGRLYGRGSGDMKAGIVAFFMAYKALQNLGFCPAADVYFQTVIEEENSGNGTLAAVLEGYKADAVLIPEPFPFIVSAQLGVMWMTIEVKGTPAHVLNTSAGINAIEAAFQLYNGLKKLEEEWNLPEVRHPDYKNAVHPINFNLGKIRGGDWASSVPSKAVIEVRVGFFPGVECSTVRKLLEENLASTSTKLPGVRYSINFVGFQAEGCVMPTDSPMMQLLGKVQQEVTGKAPEYKPITATTDARYFQLYRGIPTTCYGPEAANIHGIDESVSLQSLNEVTKVFANFIVKWCDVEPK